jgi:two-component system, NtrC family, sensor kinase
VISRFDGEWLEIAATYGPLMVDRRRRTRFARDTVAGRAIIDRRMVHIEDILAESDAEYGTAKRLQAIIGYRTMLATPLMRAGEPIGSILVRHNEVRPFTDRQVALLEAFAHQAVIAIENARLFSELERCTSMLWPVASHRSGAAR